MSSRTIVIAAGGTGGHFFPAEALADTLAERGHHLVLMTDGRAGKRESGVFARGPQYVLSGVWGRYHRRLRPDPDALRQDHWVGGFLPPRAGQALT